MAKGAKKRKRKPKERAVRGPKSGAQTAREWFDTMAYMVGRTVSGVVPVGLGALGGVELLSPEMLTSIHMSPDMATTLFTAGCAYVGLPIFKARAMGRSGDGKQ